MKSDEIQASLGIHNLYYSIGIYFNLSQLEMYYNVTRDSFSLSFNGTMVYDKRGLIQWNNVEYGQTPYHGFKRDCIYSYLIFKVISNL